MSQKIWILTSIKARTEPRSQSYEGEYVTQSEAKRHFLDHTKLFRIKSIIDPKSYLRFESLNQLVL